MKRYLNLRSLYVAFFLLLALMLIATLYPFNFFPPNGVQWVSDKPGLYFNGHGMAYTERGISISEKKTVTVELLLKERSGSKNWGPREIFSFYDGCGSPSLLVGQWDSRIFLYSRFEKDGIGKWYKRFCTHSRFPRNKPHVVAVTFGEDQKEIYIDGELINKKKTELYDASNVDFSGMLMLGNSPTGKCGWWGEVKGLAIYDRVLRPGEIIIHSKEVLEKRIIGLAETPGLLALYPFDEGKGNTTESIVEKSSAFHIPKSRNSLFATMWNMPGENMRFDSINVEDCIRNIVFFIPFAIFYSLIILRKYALGYFASILVVTMTGSLLSIGIEITQLFLPTRVSGILDVFCNVLGAMIGALIVMFFKAFRKRGSGW